MTWMQVPGEKLLEPVVNLVIKHFVLSNSSNLTGLFPFSSLYAPLFGDLHCTDLLAGNVHHITSSLIDCVVILHESQLWGVIAMFLALFFKEIEV